MSTGHVTAATANSKTFVSLVSVTGSGGVLTAVGVASGANYHYFRITIDGVVLVTDILTGSNATVVSANNGLGVALPFVDSFQVEVRDAPNASALTKYWAAWTTTHSQPIEGPSIRTDELDGQLFLREQTTYGDQYEENRYEVDVLVGPQRWSQVELDTDYYLAEEEITGKLLVWEETGADRKPVFLGSASLLVRPAGSTRTLDGFELANIDGRREFSYNRDSYAIHNGQFEIVADLDGYANVPGKFYCR